MTPKKPKYDVPSLKMGFGILEYLARFPRGRMLTDIATELSCPISSAYRFAMTLEDMGLVLRDPETKQIRLTNKLLMIGQRAITETNLMESALDIMREARDQMSDTVLLGVRDGAEIIVLDQVTGSRMFCFVAKLGYRISVYCSAPGKAILAFLPEKEREEVIAATKFIKYNERTLATEETLRRELVSIVKHGFSFDNSEQFEGIFCIGAPVFDRSGFPVAAIWSTGLMMDFDRKRKSELGSQIRAYAERISHRLGYQARK